MGKDVCFDWDEANPHPCQRAVDVVVFGAGFVFAHAVVTHPVVSYLAATPVSSREFGEGLGASFLGWMIGREGGDLRHFIGVGGAGAAYDGQTAATGQVCFERFEGVNFYVSLVEASVGGVGFFCVGKRGSPLGPIGRQLCRRDGFRF